jgi:hypothetical protein
MSFQLTPAVLRCAHAGYPRVVVAFPKADVTARASYGLKGSEQTQTTTGMALSAPCASARNRSVKAYTAGTGTPR